MEPAPRLSLCIPAGAGPAASVKVALAGALQEAASCPPGAVEVLVSGNGAPEATWALVREFQQLHPGLRRTQLARPGPGYANPRHCLREARGEFAWILGDHDLFLPGSVAQVLAAAEAGADVILGDALQANVELTRFQPCRWLKQPHLGGAWPVAGPQALLDWFGRLDYAAGEVWTIGMMVVRREPFLAALPELPARLPADHGQLAGLIRRLERPAGLHWIAQPLVMKRRLQEDPRDRDPWLRLARDQEAWDWIAQACLGDRPGLREAFLDAFRAGAIRSHCIATAADPEGWARARARLAAAGFDPLRMDAMRFAYEVLLDRVPPPRGLEARDACLVDLPLVARGARRIAVLVEAGPEAPAACAWLAGLRRATRAEAFRVVCPPELAPSLAGFELQPLDRPRFLAEEAYRERQLGELGAFAPDLLVNLGRAGDRAGEMLSAAAGAFGALGFGQPYRPGPDEAVPSHATRLLRGRACHRLLPADAPLEALTEALGLGGRPGFQAPAPRVRWEGSQFVYHSLAHVNRQLCLGLERSGRVELSLLPYEPDQFAGASVPAFRPLAAAQGRVLAGPAAVHVRHQWPPDFQPPAEGAWVMIQPWEFGGIPAEWVAPMRDLVDEVWVPSSWLKDCYVQSGVPASQVVVVPNGVDGQVFRPEGERFPLATAKACRFLFVGGTIHRKGIDLLLDAYLRSFRRGDDVCLVIKDQGQGVYAGHGLALALAGIRRDDPEAPEIEYLAGNLTEAEIAALYRSCDVLVLPYRGEGFGLPIAEAMASGLPVLVTGRGAARDFAREEWAYLIPSRPVAVAGPEGFQPSQAGFWLEEPDPGVLAALLRRAYADPEERRAMGLRARAFALAGLGWERPAALALERIEVLAARPPRRQRAPAPAAAPEAVPVQREAFLYQPDWSQAEWAEVLLSFLLAFKPDDPVALVLPWAGTPGEPGLEEIQTRVLGFARSAGLQAFPDIVLVDQPGDLAGVLAGYPRVTRVPRGRGAVAGLGGDQGLRLAAARARLARG